VLRVDRDEAGNRGTPPSFYPPLREAALCHESQDSGNPTCLPSGRGWGQCGFGAKRGGRWVSLSPALM